ncbi:MAG TPA: YihY/virulence factor BrkB family protein [Pirellulales bacterium]|jgi:membrane protein|nr:YihY/virulence factor BrkB family protein [Pirellulales bacterium]
MKRFWLAAWRVLAHTARRWAHGSSSRLGAGLAYYFVFSIAPLLVVAIAVASWVFGEAAIRGEVASQLESFMGSEGAATVQEMLRNAKQSHSASWITGLSTAIILFAASQGVAALRDALNTIWGVSAAVRRRGWWWTLWGWGRAMLLVLAFGGLLVVSLVLTTVLSSIAAYAPTAIDGFVPRVELINTVVSAIVMFLLFAMIFKWLPDVKIAWSDVWAGSAVTTVLFLLGKEVLAMYLTHVGAASAYGASSSLALLLLWAYYSSQILLVGGELVRVYAEEIGSHVGQKTPATTPPATPPIEPPSNRAPQSIEPPAQPMESKAH